MAPSRPENDADADFETAVRTELEGRDGVASYEITESTPGHVVAKVTERSASGDERTSLYRIECEPGPEEATPLHWTYLGEVVDGEDGSS